MSSKPSASISALEKIEKLAADALAGNRNEQAYSANEAAVMMAAALAEIEQLAHDAFHHGASTGTDYSRLRPCPMCSAATGQPCKVLSNYDGTYKPGDTRPVPHFYRTEIGK